MQVNRLFSFVGSDHGPWKITEMQCIRGEALTTATHLGRYPGRMPFAESAYAWMFTGITSNERYVEAAEKKQLVAKQEPLGRVSADSAAMILIRKNDAWWKLSQDERRHIIEAQSAHIAIGLKYLPKIARALHHCRDLGENEPFDFITWFEFTRHDKSAFDNLVSELRSSAEWKYVDREIDIRISRSN